jgi:phosphoglycerate dehydrogenase-like enzyme
VSWRVFITARTISEAGQSALELLRAAGSEVVIPPKLGPLDGRELLPLLTGMDAGLVSADQYSAEVLASPNAGRLKILSRWGVGYDSIDVAAATRLGIAVAYTPGMLDETVAEYTFALLLALARRVPTVHSLLSAGGWQTTWGHDLAGKTLGILGCGRIGQAVARRATGFNLRLLACDVAPPAAASALGVRFVSFAELLAESDFLTIHAALTPANHGLIGAAQLRQMKRTAYLINTARGALVDEAALVQALTEGWIAGAALDTFVVEPLPAGHPLRRAPNVILSPHQASFTYETGARVSLAAARAIVDLMEGRQPRIVVNPEVFASPALRARLAPASACPAKPCS